MKYAFVLLIFCASCTSHKEPSKTESSAQEMVTPTPTISSNKTLTMAPKGSPTPVPAERELQKITKWFEQMDAILRESLWVLRKERPPQSKSIFGKMQRAALIEMKQKLSNKSLFRCDVYSMSRKISSASGVPQTADVFHKCSTKESFVQIGDWSHLAPNELIMNFRGGELGEVLGFTTGVFSPKIHCEMKANSNDVIESFSCKGLMVDYNPQKNQVLRFNRFEYERTSKEILHLRAEVLENLDPIRKIETDIPVDGKILVTETVLQEPVVESKPAPPPPKPSVTPVKAKPKEENPYGQGPQDENNPQVAPPIQQEPQQQQRQEKGYEGQAEGGEVVEPQSQNQQQQVPQNGGSIKAVPQGEQQPQQNPEQYQQQPQGR
jgi:hypothetical protein